MRDSAGVAASTKILLLVAQAAPIAHDDMAILRCKCCVAGDSAAGKACSLGAQDLWALCLQNYPGASAEYVGLDCRLGRSSSVAHPSHVVFHSARENGRSGA